MELLLIHLNTLQHFVIQNFKIYLNSSLHVNISTLDRQLGEQEEETYLVIELCFVSFVAFV